MVTRHKLVGILAVILLSGTLSGCFLRSIFGNIFVTPDTGDFVDTILANVFGDSTMAVCLDQGDEGLECQYIVDGERVSSSFYLISEFDFVGFLIDPLILQIPANATGIRAELDDGTGPQPALVQTPQSFFVTPDTEVFPEPGQKFVIIEAPPEMTTGLPAGDPSTGKPISFSLNFETTRPHSNPPEPLAIKAMLSVKVAVNGRPYYLPMLPCVTDFSAVPAIQLPVAPQAVNLSMTLGDLLRQSSSGACFHQPYFFTSPPPPGAERVYLPAVQR